MVICFRTFLTFGQIERIFSITSYKIYTLNLKWNKCHWPADWNEIKPWLSQVSCNLSNCRKEAWKNSGLNRIWTCAFLILVGCCYQLSYWSSHMLEAMHTELDKGDKFLKKLWCCFIGRVKQGKLVLSTKLIL